MNTVFVILLLVGLCAQTLRFGGEAALASLIAGAYNAATLCLSLLGAYLFWMGLLVVMRRAGLLEKLTRLLRPVIAWLMPGASTAYPEIAGNFAANMLGMGNAATPLGIAAMQKLHKGNPSPDVATRAMLAFFLINISGLQIIPTGIFALRAGYGSAQATAVFLPILLSSLIDTLIAVLFCRWVLRA
ncbi:MAG: hypothetical protein FWF10_05815 [Clostridiales bacterium]|nr:hypothetical protein [Clostridiales bacterium]